MYILDKQTNTLVEAEIVKGRVKDMPLKKDGWNFNWKSTIKRKDTETYFSRVFTEEFGMNLSEMG